MVNAGQIVAALRDVSSTKSLTTEEVTDLVKDGILAGLAKIYGPNVEAEIEIDEQSGEFDIVVLRRVVEEIEDSSTEISLKEARWDDDTFEIGDVMEIPVEFSQFGRNAVMAMKQRIVQRVRENERDRIREEFADLEGDLLSGEVQQIERGKIVVMLNRSRDAEAIIPWKEQNPRERFRQGDPIRAVLKKVEETPRGRGRAQLAEVEELPATPAPQDERLIFRLSEMITDHTQLRIFCQGVDHPLARAGRKEGRQPFLVIEPHQSGSYQVQHALHHEVDHHIRSLLDQPRGVPSGGPVTRGVREVPGEQ